MIFEQLGYVGALVLHSQFVQYYFNCELLKVLV